MKLNLSKNTFLLIAFIGLAFTTANAQSFSWGNPVRSLNEFKSTLSHAQDKNFYEINWHYNDSVFNNDLRVTSFDLGALNKVKMLNLSVPQPVMGMNLLTQDALFQEKNSDYVIFLEEFNSKTKQTDFSSQRVNIETGVKSKPVILTSMPKRNNTFFVAQSPNKAFYAVLKSGPYDKKLNESIGVMLLDKDMKIVREITFETPYLNKSPLESNIYVSNQGAVFVVKTTELAKMKPFKTLYFWDGSTATMQETTLKFDNDYQIYQLKGQFDNDDFYVHGLYTKIGSKSVQLYSGNVPAAGVYAARFSSKGVTKYIVKNETGEIANLNMKDFVFDGSKTWLLADKMFVSDKNRPMVNGTPTFEKDYTFNNKGIFFAKLDNETGKLEWQKDLKFDEPDTMNDKGVFLSYLYFVKDNGLTILYNDTQKTKYNGYVVNDRFVQIEKYDDRGNPIGASLIPLTGLEIDSNGNYDLDTSVNVKLENGKYIVRGKSASSEKYGYLTF